MPGTDTAMSTEDLLYWTRKIAERVDQSIRIVLSYYDGDPRTFVELYRNIGQYCSFIVEDMQPVVDKANDSNPPAYPIPGAYL
jgi:hypothetical protein